MRTFRAISLWSLCTVPLLLTTCDLYDRFTGEDPFGQMVRDNPVDPGSASSVAADLAPKDGATVSDTTPVLAWKGVAGVASYRIQVSQTRDFTEPVLVDDSGITGAQYHLEKALPNHATYYWRLRPRLSSGAEGGWSAAWSFSVELPVSTVTAPSPGAIVNTVHPTLSWQSQTEAAYYEIQLSVVSDFSSLTEDGTTSSSYRQVSSVLADNQLYYWRVRLVDAHSVAGRWSEVWSFTVAYPKPANPTPAHQSAVSTKMPLLQWDADPDATAYQVQFGETSDFSSIPNHDTGIPEYQVPTDLTAHHIYCWRARAMYGGTPGAWSDGWSFEESGILWKTYIQSPNAGDPSVAPDGTIYVVSAGQLWALGPDGSHLWERPTSGYSVVIGPSGRIYAVGTYGISAFSPQGDLLWSSLDWLLSVGGDGTLYVEAFTGGHLVACDEDGNQKWEQDFLVDDAVVGADGSIFAVGLVYVSPSYHMALRAVGPDGGEKWTWSFGDYLPLGGMAVGADGSIYIEDLSTPTLMALGPDGTRKWGYDLPQWADPYLVVGESGTVYFSTRAGIIGWLNPDGSLNQQLQTEYRWNEARISLGADGVLYFTAWVGGVVALASDGSTLWRTYPYGAAGFRHAVMGSQGTLYASCTDGYLYAIETDSGGPADSSWPMYRHDPQHTARSGAF